MKKALKIGLWTFSAILFFAISTTGFYFLFCTNLSNYNFDVVKEGQIYRSSLPSEEFLEEVIEKYKIKSIVALTSSAKDSEKKIADKHGINFYHFKMSAKNRPPEKAVQGFLKKVQNPKNLPMLIHCRAGADRTGVIVAIWRIEFDNYTLEQAKSEMLYYRHLPFFMPKQYEYLNETYGQKN